ncbi:deoxyguanosinetriphosphate triphosphohydrolase [Altererythrobacter aquiaggeris]|uniref:deoxyguanosinetriphosphate triphosphohydrolase n=1 Tax=Aestuarierythrobacter aquiaggeris TaxID=1898396 RepID=UPI00301A211A
MDRAKYASDPATSRGREFPEDRGDVRGPRSAFQRDRDRIIHSISFRRLRHKTQVFVAPDGDHYRVRLTHSLECAQIGRTVARALRLDEDLTEALCLAHDIGHPPFGHAGEAALQSSMARYGGFDHNAQTLRTLMRLDSPYCSHDGLNLSWEVLEGLAKHNGPVQTPNWALTQLDEAFPMDLGEFAGLEAQVSALADDIAYDNHDIDDGLRAGFLNLDDLLTLDFVADQWRLVEARFPSAPLERQLRELVRGQIGLMVNDLVENTRENLQRTDNIADVRAAGMPLARFSLEMAEQERKLKAFMYDRLYYHPDQQNTAERAGDVVARLYAAYDQSPDELADGWRQIMPEDQPARARHIADFIAGMTDRYAINECARIYGSVPEGLRNV